MLPLPRSCLNILCTQHFFKGDRIFAQPTDLHSSQERWKKRRIRSQPSSPRHCRCQAEHHLSYACCAFSATICANSSPPGIRSDMRECTGGTRPNERHRQSSKYPTTQSKTHSQIYLYHRRWSLLPPSSGNNHYRTPVGHQPDDRR